MTAYRILADIVEALRTLRLEHESMRADMATKLAALESKMDNRLDVVTKGMTKLGVEFEAFRHDTKITLDILSELMARTGRHEQDIAALKNRTGRVERHLKLRPLPDDQ